MQEVYPMKNSVGIQKFGPDEIMYSRTVTLFLKILHKNEHFFENEKLNKFLDCCFGTSFNDIRSYLLIAKVFYFVETDQVHKATAYIKSMDQITLSRLKETCVDKPNLIEMDFVDASIQKTLMMLCYEKCNIDFFEFLLDKGFDIIDLGKYKDVL